MSGTAWQHWPLGSLTLFGLPCPVLPPWAPLMSLVVLGLRLGHETLGSGLRAWHCQGTIHWVLGGCLLKELEGLQLGCEGEGRGFYLGL